MGNRIGAVAIVIEGGKETAMNVQNILSDFSDIISGRMGIPKKEHNISVISVIVEGKIERLSAFTGKLGKLQNVTVKSAITSVEV
ncbi:MAG: TM1266 family iron-only hydrogenase system putative regulator [Bacillota bacterium]